MLVAWKMTSVRFVTMTTLFCISIVLKNIRFLLELVTSVQGRRLGGDVGDASPSSLGKRSAFWEKKKS